MSFFVQVSLATQLSGLIPCTLLRQVSGYLKKKNYLLFLLFRFPFTGSGTLSVN